MSNCMTTSFRNSRRLSECCQNTIRWFQPSEPTTLHTPMRRRRTDSCGLEGNVFPWAALLRKTARTGSPFQYSWNCEWFRMNSHRHCIISHRRSWDITLLPIFHFEVSINTDRSWTHHRQQFTIIISHRYWRTIRTYASAFFLAYASTFS